MSDIRICEHCGGDYDPAYCDGTDWRSYCGLNCELASSGKEDFDEVREID